MPLWPGYLRNMTSQAELDTSLVWYADNIDQYRIINDSVTSRLRAKSNLLAEQKSKMDVKLSGRII